VSIPASPIPAATVSASAVKKGSKKKTSLIDNLVMPSWLIMALKYLEPLANTDSLKDLMRSLVDFERSQNFERGVSLFVLLKLHTKTFYVRVKHGSKSKTAQQSSVSGKSR